MFEKLSEGVIDGGEVVGHTIAASIVAFAATNLDDLLLLVVFFSETQMIMPSAKDGTASSTLRPIHVVMGQTIGFTLLVAVR